MNELSAVHEFYNLVQKLTLTPEEQKSYLEWEYYNSHKNSFKRCKTCGKIKPLSEFYKNVLKKQGVFDECKECVRVRTKRQRMKSYILDG